MLKEERNAAALGRIKPRQLVLPAPVPLASNPFIATARKSKAGMASEKQVRTGTRATAVTGSRPGAVTELPSWASYVPASKSTEDFRIQREHSQAVIPKVYVSSSLKLRV